MKLLILLLMFASPAAAARPAGRDVDIITLDGVALKATYFAAARPGPAVLLMHMCITTRTSWEPVAQQLSAAGISALTIDNRGFGERLQRLVRVVAEAEIIASRACAEEMKEMPAERLAAMEQNWRQLGEAGAFLHEVMGSKFKWDDVKNTLPTRVFDDGRRTWIEFPASVAATASTSFSRL